MLLFGFNLPLWAVFAGGIVLVYIAWKIIKFAVKILLILIVFLAILFGLDLIGFFGWIQGMLSSFI
jgi:hypothetical protein